MKWLYCIYSLFQLRSPLQLVLAVDQDQREELEAMIHDLEEENLTLQQEYERLRAEQEPEQQTAKDEEMIAEARLLRQHKVGRSGILLVTISNITGPTRSQNADPRRSQSPAGSAAAAAAATTRPGKLVKRSSEAVTMVLCSLKTT